MTQEPADTGRLYVPLRDAACGVSLRLFRDRDGSRCAVGFTSAEGLERLLGPQQQYYRLTEAAVRSLARERSVSALIVDPGLVAAAVSVDAPSPVAPSLVAASYTAPTHAHADTDTVADTVTVPTTPIPQPDGQPRFTWHPELAGLLAVSAITGAAALLMQVIP
jgi:hypothetical protein